MSAELRAAVRKARGEDDLRATVRYTDPHWRVDWFDGQHEIDHTYCTFLWSARLHARYRLWRIQHVPASRRDTSFVEEIR